MVSELILGIFMTTSGLKFSETMSGPFSLNETDTHKGAIKGRAESRVLAMHANVLIDDIDAFIADKDHQGGLSGLVDFPGFGQGIPSHSGVFNLFSPGDDSETRYMVYELGFSQNGDDYYLAGHKVVRDDPGFDMLADTTTLYTKLYMGTDKSGTVVGAGILTLGVFDLMSLVSTIRTTGTSGAGESAAVIAKFGKFFMGELWERYGPAMG